VLQCVACSALQCVAVPQHDALQQSYCVILRLQYDAMQHTKISQKRLRVHCVISRHIASYRVILRHIASYRVILRLYSQHRLTYFRQCYSLKRFKHFFFCKSDPSDRTVEADTYLNSPHVSASNGEHTDSLCSFSISECIPRIFCIRDPNARTGKVDVKWLRSVGSIKL